MNTRAEAARTASSTARPDIGSSYLLGLVFAGLLVAASYPVVTLAVVLGAATPRAWRGVRARVARLQTPPTGSNGRRANRRSRRGLSD